MIRSGAFSCGLLILFVGCASTPEPARQEPVPVETVERARALAATFKGTLKEALFEGLEDGPAEAMGACGILAPELAAELSVDGVRIGRTSHRLRNPANQAAPWVRPLVEEYRQTAPGAEPKAVWIDDSTVGYVEPLYIGKPCLVCHGEAVQEKVLEEIHAIYPEDNATGYHEGEFRGVVWVEIR